MQTDVIETPVEQIAPVVTAPIPAPAPEVKNKTITLTIPEPLHKQLIGGANVEGVKLEEFSSSLLQSAVNSKDLVKGKVVDVSEEVLQQIGQRVKETIEAVKTPVVEEVIKATEESVNQIVFTTNSEIIELVAKINANRKVKGLAPLENSACEVLLYYIDGLSNNSISEEVTGLSYKGTKAILKTFALAEREANNAQSNIIETKGIFADFTIVNTPQ